LSTQIPIQTPEFRWFLRAFAEEIDSTAKPGKRDDMLRGVGARLAKLMPVPPVESLAALEMEMNDVLASVGWGQARLEMDESERTVLITHTGLPRLGSLGSPPGTWLSAVLEGLYGAWMAQQPGSVPDLAARRVTVGDTITLRFGRG